MRKFEIWAKIWFEFLFSTYVEARSPGTIRPVWGSKGPTQSAIILTNGTHSFGPSINGNKDAAASVVDNCVRGVPIQPPSPMTLRST